MDIDVSWDCKNYHDNQAVCDSIVAVSPLDPNLNNVSAWSDYNYGSLGFSLGRVVQSYHAGNGQIQLRTNQDDTISQLDGKIWAIPTLYYMHMGNKLHLPHTEGYLPLQVSPFCSYTYGGSQSCAGPTTEKACKDQSSSCTRTPPSSSSSSSLKCYRQGTTAAVADSECATLAKPQCSATTPTNPTPTPTACTPGEQRDCTPDSKGDPCQLKKTCGLNGKWGECKSHVGNHDMHCNVDGQSVYCGPAGILLEGTVRTCSCVNRINVTFDGIIPDHSPRDEHLSLQIGVRNGWSDPCQRHNP